MRIPHLSRRLHRARSALARAVVRQRRTPFQAKQAWPPAAARKTPEKAPTLIGGGGAEDLRPAARLSRRAGRERAARGRSDRDRLRRRRAHVGARDAGLHVGAERRELARADQRRRRPRRYEQRRRDGQAHGVRRQAGAAARDQGPRSGRPRRRAAEPLADDRTPTATSRPTRRISSATTTAAPRRASSTTPTACSGRWTTSSTRPRATSTCG